MLNDKSSYNYTKPKLKAQLLVKFYNLNIKQHIYVLESIKLY